LRKRVSRIAVGIAIAALGSTLVTAANAHQQKRKHKPKLPDLTIVSADLTSDSYLFQDEPGTLSFTDRTKNVGSARAKQTFTHIVIRPIGYPIGTLDSPGRRVPALKPGESHRASASKTFPKIPLGSLGPYQSLVCANSHRPIPEKTRRNNCLDTGTDLDVIPRRFVGTVEGSGPWGGGTVKDEWSGTVTFVFDHADPGGIYRYNVEHADVTWTTSGSTNNCSYSGTGHATIVNGTGFLTLRYETMDYFAGAGVMPGLYQVTVTCGNHTSYEPGPGPGVNWFAMNPTTWDVIAPINGYTTLAGAYDCAPTCHNKWSWSLDAK
jgi:hypothetical protein